MTISMKVNNSIRVAESIAAPGPFSAALEAIIQTTGYPYTRTSGLAWNGTVTLSGGAATINMTILARTGLSTIDATTYKLWLMYVMAAAANTQSIVIVPGASNGYGAADIGAEMILKPGSERWVGPLQDGSQVVNSIAVDSTHKNIDISSAHATASLQVILLFAPGS